jgi:ribosomal protein S6--L-glutamate ligase
MRVCAIVDRPDHPVVGAAMERLGRRHTVHILLAGALDADTLRLETSRPADAYLLKSRSRPALQLGEMVAGLGATVINRPHATAICLDRAATADRMHDAGLPYPRTVAFDRLGDITGGLDYPVMLKSRHSRRGDLVVKVDSAGQLEGLASEWGDEPVVSQAFSMGDGYDLKLWAIGGHLHAARRRTPLETGATGDAKRNLALDVGSLPAGVRRLGEEVGQAFALDLYGVDVIMTADGPSIVDVNAFPGFRGVPGAPDLLAALVEQSRQGEVVA